MVDKEELLRVAASIAAQESEATGKSYYECISNALDEACERLGIGRKEYIRMFV